jgi:hypothetical protein
VAPPASPQTPLPTPFKGLEMGVRGKGQGSATPAPSGATKGAVGNCNRRTGINMLKVRYDDDREKNKVTAISGLPDYCPVCKQNTHSRFCYAYLIGGPLDITSMLEVVCQCGGCKHLFIGYYRDAHLSSLNDYLVLSETYLPLNIKYVDFPKIINNISNDFSIIYNQSFIAEINGLDQISGPGYRRALEFLVKDYLIYLKPENADDIKKMLLGKAIEKIHVEKIKNIAKRAAWLGNDETHYIRKWKDKDIQNLKELIDLVVKGIELEELGRKYDKEMP